ncbi:helix-turn-helix transcriptional regulator [Stenotrophomonas sp. 24(2023)]|uniref:AraC family transcriptional regulator n=1 Tax=Stenotrophomonas sp. 24(2023) TaxID=3068324 RepID=UPI0027DF6147|nr:helix-turn-helix transcriptional regulator [Stenotrophomonas sp. 24(2023)]WMJ69255.1 helix-turn-helix transcriptional regulator [Stenotrophomonas sp. 24(2023)]
MPIRSSLAQLLRHFDPDADGLPVTALRLEVDQHDVELPVHQHRKGQLVIARHGAVTCRVPGALWLVPPQHAVWIPGSLPHSNHGTHNARISYLFIEPGAAPMPPDCCTLQVSPLLRELVDYLAEQPHPYPADGPTARVAGVLLEQLVAAPVARFHLPISDHPTLQRIATALTRHPDDRSTLAQWAQRVAMGERTLARLIQQQTGLSFGRWRQQIHLLVALRELAAGMSVQQVAGLLGYDSATAFITMFRKAMGKPPAQYFASLG